jgi:hypothetical protein
MGVHLRNDPARCETRLWEEWNSAVLCSRPCVRIDPAEILLFTFGWGVEQWVSIGFERQL